MKWIKYKYYISENSFLEKEMGWNEINEKVAQREAYNGEYTIYDDGQIPSIESPSDLDKLEAKLAYLAMMTGYEEILEA